MKISVALENVHQALLGADIGYYHGIEGAWDEAVALVLYVLELPADAGDEVLDKTVTDAQWSHIQSLLKQRIQQHMPMAYLTQQAWFMGLPFYVDQRVLIPRSPFAEWIERQFSPWTDVSQVKRILEIGTGSGCMAIAASYVFPEAEIDAVDISTDALAVAELNVQQHGVDGRVHLHRSDCFEALSPSHQYDIIMANPPYVCQAEMKELPAEFAHEPGKTALYADNEGMAVVDRILKQASQYMSEHAILIVEVGYSDEILMRHYPKAPFTWLPCEFGGQGLFLLTRDQLEQCDEWQ